MFAGLLCRRFALGQTRSRIAAPGIVGAHFLFSVAPFVNGGFVKQKETAPFGWAGAPGWRPRVQIDVCSNQPNRKKRLVFIFGHFTCERRQTLFLSTS